MNNSKVGKYIPFKLNGTVRSALCVTDDESGLFVEYLGEVISVVDITDAPRDEAEAARISDMIWGVFHRQRELAPEGESEAETLIKMLNAKL